MEKVETKTPMLENFGRDITKLAEEGKLDPVVGRKNEIERIEQILSRRKKNNPVLIGEPGVGKSAIAEGLAMRILQKKVSRNLFDKRVVALDIASIVAGTKYRGQFEERMKAILDELTKNTNIILFIDEIHTIVGAGNSAGAMDASNMLKPALARGELQCIGATTLNEYRKHIESDGALERRFQKVTVEPTNPEETIEILNNIKSRYEDHHIVEYTDDAIKACVTLTNRYITDRFLPDKAIDALDEAGSSVHISNVNVPKIITDIENDIQEVKTRKKEAISQQKFEEAADYRDTERELNEKLEIEQKKWLEDSNIKREPVTEEHIAKVVSLMTGIPLEKISIKEGNKLLKMEDDLNAVVIGQSEAIKKVVKSIRRNRAGLKDPNRPIGTFMFLGSTGVGKCHGKGTKILMFDGTIKNVEDVKVGDLLMGDDSTPRKVLSLARGRDNMYRIIPLNGGDPFTCNSPHILSLKKTGSYEILNIPLNEYLEKNRYFKHIYKLWRTSVEFESKPVLIEPYFMGLWLGDGNSSNVGITTADPEIVDYVYKIADKWGLKVSIHSQIDNKSKTYNLVGKTGGEFYDNTLMKSFRSYLLMSKKIDNKISEDSKFIPDDYLYNDTNTRKKLLAGLIDSDGYQFHNCYQISTKYKNLAEQISFLSRSLGYRTNIKSKVIKDTEYYLVNICGDLSDLEYLLDRKRSTKRLQKKNVSLTSFNVEYIGVDDYYGFEIDNNHLYLLGDFTVTHNTHLSKMLAKIMFDNPEALIRVDMSEYMEKFSVSKLIGAPPGYVGYNEGGQLTEKIRRHPYSILLLDEIEKAHPDVFHILLQVLDDGVLTDSYGRKVDFKNTIIIMTSNIGSRKLKDFGQGVGFMTSAKAANAEGNAKSVIEKELKKSFSPEFLNRVDDVIVFESLGKEDIFKIIDIEMSGVYGRLKEMNVNVEVTDKAKSFICDKGWDEAFGARPLKRAISKYVEDPLAEEIIKANFGEGDTIVIDYVDGAEDISVSIRKKEPEKKVRAKKMTPEMAN